MKYLYFIAGILIIISGLAAYHLTHSRVKVSKPFLVVNDRIMTRQEVETLIKEQPGKRSVQAGIESVITHQLLIQEALKQGISKEEPFRRAVEKYYEQSLVRFLADRKLKSFKAEANQEELDRYLLLCRKRVVVSKFEYPSMKEAKSGKKTDPKRIEADFTQLSGDIKWTLLTLKKGRTSLPAESADRVFVLRLDDVQPVQGDQIASIDINEAKAFILKKKKEAMMAAWIRKLRNNAEVWREK